MIDFQEKPAHSKQKQHSGIGSGKLILLGEHSVVYGKPAIAASINRGARAILTPHEASKESNLKIFTDCDCFEVTPQRDGALMSQVYHGVLDYFGIKDVDVTIHLDLPVKSGMGSSAAIATALVRACASFVGGDSDKLIHEAITKAERVFHGTPSGIDQAAASGCGVFLFRPTTLGIEPLNVSQLPLAVAVADRPSSTYDEVARVAKLHVKRPKFYSTIDSLIEQLVLEGIKALESHDFEHLGALMNDNHGLLYTIGCSTPKIERAREIALDTQATGAKVTGAGGGGCVIAMAKNPESQLNIVEAWKDVGITAFTADMITPQSAKYYTITASQ